MKALSQNSNEAAWAEKPEIGGSFATLALLSLYRYLGNPLAAVTCRVLPPLVYQFDRTARLASEEYLGRVLGRTATKADVIRHFSEFAQTVRLAVDSWMHADSDIKVSWSDLDHLNGGHGLVVIGAHFGPLEALRSLSARLENFRLWALVYQANSRGFRGALAKTNPKSERDVIPAERFDPTLIFKLQALLDGGDSVALLADRVTPNAPKRFLRRNFLGAPARFAEGPFLMAYLLKRPACFLVPHFDSTARTLTFSGVLLPKIDHLPRNEAINTLADAYVQHLEAACRRTPYLWFNFFKYWE